MGVIHLVHLSSVIHFVHIVLIHLLSIIDEEYIFSPRVLNSLGLGNKGGLVLDWLCNKIQTVMILLFCRRLQVNECFFWCLLVPPSCSAFPSPFPFPIGSCALLLLLK